MIADNKFNQEAIDRDGWRPYPMKIVQGMPGEGAPAETWYYKQVGSKIIVWNGYGAPPSKSL